MSNPMSFKEAGELIKMIYIDHSPFSRGRGQRIVKYVDPHFDMRTGHCFALTLRGYGWEETFHTQNECRDLPDSLYDHVVKFLKE
jgi:hypothetical protein